MKASIRNDFPLLSRYVAGQPLVYLDNAATMQKPQVVIEAIEQYYRQQNANVHRGLHYLSEQATQAYEQARQIIQRFIGAASAKQIIFTKGTTGSD